MIHRHLYQLFLYVSPYVATDPDCLAPFIHPLVQKAAAPSEPVEGTAEHKWWLDKARVPPFHADVHVTDRQQIFPEVCMTP